MASDRLDAIRLRIGVESGQTADALRVLGSGHPNLSQDRVYLLDQPASPSALDQSGVTVMMRVFAEAHRLVVQVRYVSRTRLTARWAEFRKRDDETLTIEEERDRVRRVLTASLSSAQGNPSILLTNQDLAPADVLSARQRDFLDDCSVLRLRDLPVRLLGPITVHSWSEFIAGLETTASRWTHNDPGGLGFDALVVCCRTTPDRAALTLSMLASGLRALGIDPDGGVDWPEERAAAYWQHR